MNDKHIIEEELFKNTDYVPTHEELRGFFERLLKFVAEEQKKEEQKKHD
jgi:hypothetical protein